MSFEPYLPSSPPIILIGEPRITNLNQKKKSIFDATVNIDGVGDIFYRYTKPRRSRHILPGPDVLLLHGEQYASETWKGLHTLQILAYWRYRAVALDLAGYKLSKHAIPPTNNHGYIEFMEQIIEKLGLVNVVIIAPSMSGIYGLPILFENSSVNLRGFIGIAPNSTNKYSIQQYKAVDIPVLLMYGERDKTKLKNESIIWMNNIPNLEKIMIEKAPHAAFANNPTAFHTELLRFLARQCSIDRFQKQVMNRFQKQVYIQKIVGLETGCVMKGPYNGFCIANCVTDNCENYSILDIAINICLRDRSCNGVVQIVPGQEIYQLRGDKKLRESPCGEITWIKLCENRDDDNDKDSDD